MDRCFHVFRRKTVENQTEILCISSVGFELDRSFGKVCNVSVVERFFSLCIVTAGKLLETILSLFYT